MRYFIRMCLALVAIALFEFSALYVFVPHAYAADWRSGYWTNNGCKGSVAASDNGPASSDGNAQCSTVENANSPTYVYTANAYTGYATPTDVFCLSGSISKTVRVTVFAIMPQSTAGTFGFWYFVKRSTLDTGGTPVTPVAADSSNAAPTAVLTQFNSAPALGTAVGNIAISPLSTTTPGNNPSVIAFTTYFSASNLISVNQPVTLRGTNEALCLNFNGVALPSGFTSTIVVNWQEM